MRPTRRVWAALFLCALTAVLAVVLDRPEPLVGTALIGAWLWSRGAHFFVTLSETRASLTVEQTPSTRSARTGESVPVSLDATLDDPSPLSIQIEPGDPASAVTDGRPSRDVLTVPPGDRVAASTRALRWPVAGRHRFDRPTVEATDGRFLQQFSAGEAPTVTIEPRGPRQIHVGAGGTHTDHAIGVNAGLRGGSGVEPAELREYVPGDTTDRIDWKATARLSTPHVREREPESARSTLFLVDHRQSLGVGTPSETALDYLREVSLATANTIRRRGDPLGLTTVGDDGVTATMPLGPVNQRYASIRRRLLELEPTGTDGEPAQSTLSADRPGSATVRFPQRPTDAHAAIDALDTAGDDSFTDTLRPFYEARRTYRQRYPDDPLVAAARAAGAQNRNDIGWAVCFTDDTRPAELRNVVAHLREAADAVTVFVAPRCLYEPSELADLESTYDRYVDAEALRRDLDQLHGVTAREVVPGDRLSAILSADLSARSNADGAMSRRGEKA